MPYHLICLIYIFLRVKRQVSIMEQDLPIIWKHMKWPLVLGLVLPVRYVCFSIHCKHVSRSLISRHQNWRRILRSIVCVIFRIHCRRSLSYLCAFWTFNLIWTFLMYWWDLNIGKPRMLIIMYIASNSIHSYLNILLMWTQQVSILSSCDSLWLCLRLLFLQLLIYYRLTYYIIGMIWYSDALWKRLLFPVNI